MRTRKRFYTIPSSLVVVAVLAVTTTAIAQSPGVSDTTRATRGAVHFGILESGVTANRVVVNPERSAVERGFADVTLPSGLDTVFVDNARLILSVSTAFDSTEPLIIAVFPASVASGARPVEWDREWDEMSGGFDPEHMAVASIESTKEDVEITLDITAFVRMWQSGELPNHGLVIKTLSEDKSTFHWLRDGRYDGNDAKLEVLFSDF